MKERIYQGIIIIFTLVFFTIFFVITYKNYMDMLDTNEELLQLIDEQRVYHDSIVKLWEDSYSELEEAYMRAINDLIELKDSKVIAYTEEEVQLLARCVEAEAGHYAKHKNSQKYVTQVILNRVHSKEFPNTIKEVIYQKSGNIPQFTVAYNGMMNREVEPETLANVYSVLMHGTDLPSYICYFYDDSVTNNWVNTLSIYDTVEGTVFAYEKED